MSTPGSSWPSTCGESRASCLPAPSATVRHSRGRHAFSRPPAPPRSTGVRACPVHGHAMSPEPSLPRPPGNRTSPGTNRSCRTAPAARLPLPGSFRSPSLQQPPRTGPPLRPSRPGRSAARRSGRSAGRAKGLRAHPHSGCSAAQQTSPDVSCRTRATAAWLPLRRARCLAPGPQSDPRPRRPPPSPSPQAFRLPVLPSARRPGSL
mmetsp:Transcript_67272/g.217146  ORF Transcript_67272/g.217146 Transcript_67272/m.217146 type:complete len:206 (+) Transcript_67272:382-999(+)